MTTASLFGKLREHELEMNRLVVQESEDKQSKGIALKACKHKQHHDSSESDEESMSLMSRKFSKFLKKNKSQASKRYGSNKPSDFNIKKYTCYGCGEQGHIKAECPNNEIKERTDFKNEKRGKAKKAYVAWDDNDVSPTSSSGDEKANICLKAFVSSSMGSSSSIKGNNYYQLLEAFNETHEEANRLALSYNRLKDLNNWMENRVKSLEEVLEKTKEDFENLDLIYKSSVCCCESKVCENCENLERKIHYLLKTLDKLTTRKSNFEDVLASQIYVFGKVSLGFYPSSKGNGISKPFSTISEKQSVKRTIQPVVTCFYCMKKCHSVRFYRFRKSLVPRWIFKWIPRCFDGFKDKSNTKGPKFFKGSNLVM